MEWANNLVARNGTFRKVCAYMPASGIHRHRFSGRQTEANEPLAEQLYAFRSIGYFVRRTEHVPT
jgi:hypothetical protein